MHILNSFYVNHHIGLAKSIFVDLLLGTQFSL